MYVKVFEPVDFVKNFEKNPSILVKIYENLNFGQGIKHFDFCKKNLIITI